MLIGVPWVMIDSKEIAAKYLKNVYGTESVGARDERREGGTRFRVSSSDILFRRDCKRAGRLLGRHPHEAARSVLEERPIPCCPYGAYARRSARWSLSTASISMSAIRRWLLLWATSAGKSTLIKVISGVVVPAAARSA